MLVLLPGDACLENMGFGVEDIECSVSLSAENVVSYEFFERVRDGGAAYDFIYEGDDFDGVKCLCKVYCNKCCSGEWSFLIKVSDYWIYYGV